LVGGERQIPSTWGGEGRLRLPCAWLTTVSQTGVVTRSGEGKRVAEEKGKMKSASPWCEGKARGHTNLAPEVSFNGRQGPTLNCQGTVGGKGQKTAEEIL